MNDPHHMATDPGSTHDPEVDMALHSPNLAALIGYRIDQIVRHGHDAASDDATSMNAWHRDMARLFQILSDRATGNCTPQELAGSAKSALKLAAMLLAYADHISRTSANAQHHAPTAVDNFQANDTIANLLSVTATQ